MLFAATGERKNTRRLQIWTQVIHIYFLFAFNIPTNAFRRRPRRLMKMIMIIIIIIDAYR